MKNKQINLSSLSKETQAAIKKELASAAEVTLRFDGYDQPKNLVDYISARYPEILEGDAYQHPKGVKIKVQDLFEFKRWLAKAPGFRSIETKLTQGKADILVRSSRHRIASRD